MLDERSSISTLFSLTFTVEDDIEEADFSKVATMASIIRIPKMQVIIEASTKPTIEPNTTRQNLRDLVSG